MNTKSFVKILRKVVREEVQRAVKEALTEQKVPHKKVINHGLSLSRMAESHSTKSKKKFSKNNMLNDILNETAETADFSNMNEGPIASQEQWPVMEDVMTTNKVESFASLMKPSHGVDVTPNTDVNGNVVNKNALPEHLTSALTKDYSAVMKAIDKKKGIK